jgi:hypothetical protein
MQKECRLRAAFFLHAASSACPDSAKRIAHAPVKLTAVPIGGSAA